MLKLEHHCDGIDPAAVGPELPEVRGSSEQTAWFVER